MRVPWLVLALGLIVAGPVRPAAAAGAATVYVALRGTLAFDTALAKAASPDLVQPNMHKGLARAMELAQAQTPGFTEVAVLVAGGNYEGKAGAGAWSLPTLSAPGLRLLILGGYDDTWGARDPFRRPTRLASQAGSGTPVFELGKKTQLKEIVVSGFVVDFGDRNAYDGEGNLTRSGSRGAALLALHQAVVDRVVLADNVLLNGAGRLVEPLVAPASAETEILIQNNLFWNDVTPVLVGVGIGWQGRVVRRVVLRKNTFLRCWPYNPDPTSAEVGAVSLHTKESAQEIVVEGNLFAHNVGGALQHDWPEERMPKLRILGNLFYGNATLLGAKEPGEGMIVGKFGSNPKHLVLDAARVADDFGYEVKDNVVKDPGLGAAPALEVGSAEGGEGHDTTVKGFAPRVVFDPAVLPVPADEALKGYGFRPEPSFQR